MDTSFREAALHAASVDPKPSGKAVLSVLDGELLALFDAKRRSIIPGYELPAAAAVRAAIAEWVRK